jgi:hypothetical protein
VFFLLQIYPLYIILEMQNTLLTCQPACLPACPVRVEMKLLCDIILADLSAAVAADTRHPRLGSWWACLVAYTWATVPLAERGN